MGVIAKLFPIYTRQIYFTQLIVRLSYILRHSYLFKPTSKILSNLHHSPFHSYPLT